ncbi:InlB B-repeat-containing protein [Wenzhouxiangella marina]|uniref:InlB B-repeat-containing protein n=1 Tax=Wenzhouxiangella marina TaxID=1579979 RepID=UPI0006739D9E|nr:hypothetical protein [Wenzhouxiangella marina]MBB6087163.1 hypothetical protein [Wenzhouxiangella marina]
MAPHSAQTLSCLSLALLLCLIGSPALAATIWVNTNSDSIANDARCSLREALSASASNAAVGGCSAGSSGTADLIRFDWDDFEGGTVLGAIINLSQGPLIVSDADLVIDNSGGRRLTVSAQNLHRVMEVAQPAAASLTLINLGLRDGLAEAPDPHGGALLLVSGTRTLTLQNMTIRSSQALAGAGGALAFGADLEVLNISESRFTSNSAGRSGVLGSVDAIHGSDLSIAISDSGFFANTALSSGGVLSLGLSPTSSAEVIRVDIVDSQFGGNSAEASGGALHFEPGAIDASLIVLDSLFEDNLVNDGAGGAINVSGGAVGSGLAVVDVQRSSFIGNRAFIGAAVRSALTPTRLINNLFLDNLSGSSAAVNVSPIVPFLSTLPSTLVGNTWAGNLASQDEGQPAGLATDLSYASDWSTGQHRLVGNLFIPVANAPACNFGQSDTSQTSLASINHNLTVSDGGQVVSACELVLSDGQGMAFEDPIAVHALREATGDLLKPWRIRFGAGSTAVDAWPRSDCRDETAFPVVLDLDRNRFVPDAGGDPIDGNPALTAACDIGAFENREGRTLDISVSGSGRVFSDPVPAIDCTGSCSSFAQQFDTVDLRWLNEPGSVFAQWDGDCSGSAECEVDLDQNRVVLATFTTTATHPIDIQLAGTGEGRVVSVNSTYGMDCPDYNCTGHFEAGSVVVLEAIPAEGSSFVAWEGDCQFGCDDPVIGLTLNGPRQYIARFDFDDAIFGDRFESP